MIFRHRDAELAELERARQNLGRYHLHALVTGLRQVGKTSLVQFYQDEIGRTNGVPTVFVQGAHVTHPAIFFRLIFEGLVDALAGTSVVGTSLGQVSAAVARLGVEPLTDRLPLYSDTWTGAADASALVQSAWQLPELVGRSLDRSVVVTIDEVQEVFHQFARVAPYRGGGGVDKSAWDARGQIQHNERAFWIFTTSLRTIVDQFFRKQSSPFYLQTHDIRVNPLDRESTLDLLREFADPDQTPTSEALESVAELSGGLPGILIQMLADCPPGAGKAEVEASIQESLRGGRLCALYTDISEGLAREGRQGSNLLLQSLHAIARGDHGPTALGRRLAIAPAQASNLLLTLERLGLIETRRVRGRRARQFQYPLMREWLLAQPAPPIGPKASDQELRTQLGFGFEARVREILRKIRAPIRIVDTREGDYLLRPNAEVIIGAFRRVERQATEPETDVIAEQDDRTLVMGCRYRREHTSGETIRDFAERQLAGASARYPGVWGVYVSATGFTQGAIREAEARGIILLSLEGLNQIARMVGEQPFTAP